jgi:hypothetical protein
MLNAQVPRQLHIGKMPPMQLPPIQLPVNCQNPSNLLTNKDAATPHNAPFVHSFSFAVALSLSFAVPGHILCERSANLVYTKRVATGACSVMK